MKQITLTKITLRNWRGCQYRETELNQSMPTYICGGNGLGKSRHFDAFCWLLFGKDRFDRKDYEVRSHDKDGNLLHKVECSVEAEIWIGGEKHVLKRESKELWQKPSGQIEEVFKGNATECTWDGTPVKVNEFAKRVKDEIIDDTLFKMLTNPHYFLETMTWKQQRECLLDMAGTATDEEIANSNPAFKALLEQLGGKSLADFRATLAAEKKRVKALLAEINPRIDQTQKMMPEPADWKSVEGRITLIEKEINDCDIRISSVVERNKAANEKVAEIQKQIFDLKAKQRVVIEDARQKAADEEYKANEERREIEKSLRVCHSALSEITTDRKRTEQRIVFLGDEIAKLNIQLEELRQEWRETNAMQFDGSNICPHCGQPLPEHMIATASAKFRESKQQRLDENCAKGKSLAAQRNGYMEELSEKQKALETLDNALKKQENLCKALNEALMSHPIVKITDIAPETLPQWREIENRIIGLEMNKDSARSEEGTADIKERKEQLMKECDAEKAILSRRTAIEKAEKEIARLQKQGRELSQQLADIEKREFTAMQFTKKKIEDSEKRINSMFEIVKFRLFDVTQDGNEYECCVPLVDGVPYGVANTAGQVNAGLDVIKTLCKFNNVCAPIFVDNAESIVEYIDMPSQMIFLKVTEDKELKVIR